MIVECIMCDEELAVEDVVLIGTKVHVKVWPCEGCQQHTAEYVQEAIDGMVSDEDRNLLAAEDLCMHVEDLLECYQSTMGRRHDKVDAYIPWGLWR